MIFTATLGPQFDVVSRTLDDSKWIVVVDGHVQAADARREQMKSMRRCKGARR